MASVRLSVRRAATWSDRFAHAPRRRGRRDHAGALPRARPARRDEARPDAGVRGRPRGRGGDPRPRRGGPGRGRARRGVRRRRRRDALDRRPDRRDEELRARHPGLGDAARARARRRRSTLRVVSAPALGRRWWAARGERRVAGDGEPWRVSAVARSRTASASTHGPARHAAGLGRVVRRAGAPAASAISGSTASSPRARSTLAAETRPDWDYAAVRLIVEEAGGRCTTFDGERPPPRAERRCPRTALLHDEAASCSARRLDRSSDDVV